MKEVFIRVGGKRECSLVDFINSNTDAEGCNISQEDITTIEKLKDGELHFVPGFYGWTKIERIKEARS